jgi:hypothetical protein
MQSGIDLAQTPSAPPVSSVPTGNPERPSYETALISYTEWTVPCLETVLHQSCESRRECLYEQSSKLTRRKGPCR